MFPCFAGIGDAVVLQLPLPCYHELGPGLNQWDRSTFYVPSSCVSRMILLMPHV